MRGREGILEVHVRGKPLAQDVNLRKVAQGTPGFTGADIENLVNEAAILAARRNKQTIGMAEFQESIERVLMGPERRSRIISEEEKEITAYHEAGHALVASQTPNADPVHKVSIVARGMAGGYTLMLPEEEHALTSRSEFLAKITVGLGGRAAEDLIFGDITTGASNDLEYVTNLARMMVTRYGMSEKLGPLTFGDREELVFLGREIGEQRNYGEKVARTIDEEVREIVTQSYERAKRILQAHKDKLNALAKRLIEVETVEQTEFEAIAAG
jgi:cell division protease FtsH